MENKTLQMVAHGELRKVKRYFSIKGINHAFTVLVTYYVWRMEGKIKKIESPRIQFTHKKTYWWQKLVSWKTYNQKMAPYELIEDIKFGDFKINDWE